MDIGIGIFPGILFGVRTYEYEDEITTDHVLYIACISIIITIYND